jgi:aspartyl-tRNA(Asn)/glutamyl-tRNA(Gln) amidotransferase subunit A
VALGSDTGGSVRQPAAFCGVVGVRPTYGRVSRYGLVAYASSLDQVGVFGARVRDAALLLQVVAGHDPRDATSARRPVPDLTDAAEAGVRGLRIGLPREYLGRRLEPGVEEACRRAARSLEEAGAEIRSLSLPHTSRALPAYYVLAPAEASSNLARYDGVRFGRRLSDASSVEELHREARSRGFGREVVRRILLGTFVLSRGYREAYYDRASRVRWLVSEDFRRAFREVDLVLTPTTPTRPFPLGERTDVPYRMYSADVFTVPASLAGLPAASVPVASSGEPPVGVQLVAPAWEEAHLIRAAAALERSLEAGP